MRRVGYHWHLRRLMAERDMFATTDLGPLLADRGVVLSREQVYRLVTGTPQRLSLTTLAALCDILACAPSDLVDNLAIAAGLLDAITDMALDEAATTPLVTRTVERANQALAAWQRWRADHPPKATA